MSADYSMEIIKVLKVLIALVASLKHEGVLIELDRIMKWLLDVILSI